MSVGCRMGWGGMLAGLVAISGALGQGLPAFPGAQGFGAVASGGRGGAVLTVTTLAADPQGVVPGSLNWALRQVGPRTIVFRVSGVIHAPAYVVHGDVTIAGQTSPGGVTVRGLVCDGHYARHACSNLIVRHLRLRPSWNLPLPAGGERLDDGLRLDGLRRFIFDHVSIAGALDEAVQLSWASMGTLQYSSLGETIGAHAGYGGMLLNYAHADFPQDQLSIHHNLWFRVGGRVPEISCEASGYPGESASVAACQVTPLRLELSHNVYHDVDFPLWYNRDVDQNPGFGPYRLQFNFVGNRFQVRPGFPYGMVITDLLAVADNQLYWAGNRMNLYPGLADEQLAWCCNDFATHAPNTETGLAQRRGERHPFPVVAHASDADEGWLDHVGALPHDPMQRRWLARVRQRSFDGPPYGEAAAADALDLDFDPATPPAPLEDRDADGMPDAFEVQHQGLGLSAEVPDANGDTLSLALLGMAGYTNLEVYLHLRALHLESLTTHLLTDSFE